VSETALIGKLPFCGHYVAIDMDPTEEHRARYERRGYIVEELPRDQAIALMQRDLEPHQPCMDVNALRADLATKTRALAAAQQDVGLADIAALQEKELRLSCERALAEREAECDRWKRAAAEYYNERDTLRAQLLDVQEDLREEEKRHRKAAVDRDELRAQLAEAQEMHRMWRKAAEECAADVKAALGGDPGEPIVPAIEKLRAQLAAKDAEIERLKKQAKDDKRSHLQDIDKRDRYEDVIAEVAGDLGCDDEWSSVHDHAVCVKEHAAQLLKRLSELEPVAVLVAEMQDADKRITALAKCGDEERDSGPEMTRAIEDYNAATAKLNRMPLPKKGPQS
jgi:hypothetical protein